MKPTPQVLDFASRLVAWQRQHGRHNLPWQVKDPYKIWLSEIMLQQTQVITVLDYYHRFVERFPTLLALASAPIDAVLALWSGLGYYHRARYLHETAQKIVTDFHGAFPQQRSQLEALPGIGRSTAAAIMVFAFGQREAILDGNVKRVLARVFGVVLTSSAHNTRQLWALADAALPVQSSDMVAYTQGLMDLGATLCSRLNPTCTKCPMQPICIAAQHQKIDAFSYKKAKVALPTRPITLLLMCHNHKLYFEKRPTKGIWGGMLSFPEHDVNGRDAKTLAVLGQGTLLEPWATFKHTLTHMHLMITPQPIQLTHNIEHMGLTGQWLLPKEALQKAIPKPIRQLLLAWEGLYPSGTLVRALPCFSCIGMPCCVISL